MLACKSRSSCQWNFEFNLIKNSKNHLNYQKLDLNKVVLITTAGCSTEGSPGPEPDDLPPTGVEVFPGCFQLYTQSLRMSSDSTHRV